MSDYNEIRFGHLRALSYEDKLSLYKKEQKILKLINDDKLREKIKNILNWSFLCYYKTLLGGCTYEKKHYRLFQRR